MILDTFLDSDGIMGLSHPFWIVTALWGCISPFHVQQFWDVLLTKCVCDRVLKNPSLRMVCVFLWMYPVKWNLKSFV